VGIEVEKKYRLTGEEGESLRRRLEEVGAEAKGGAEFEENVVYTGPGLDPRSRVLRLRRKGARALFTFKEREPSASAVKRQREEETEVAGMRAAPQFPQNRSPASVVPPQAGHVAASGTPHCVQNLRPSRF